MSANPIVFQLGLRKTTPKRSGAYASAGFLGCVIGPAEHLESPAAANSAALASTAYPPPDTTNIATPPTTLLNLPDEILSRIFRHVHALCRSEGSSVPPTRYLHICRRIYHVARPIWFSVLRVPHDFSAADRFLGHLIDAKELHQHVKDLEVVLTEARPLHAAVISACLTNLEILRMTTFAPPETDSVSIHTPDQSRVPDAAVRLIHNLSSLKTLVCVEPDIHFPDASSLSVRYPPRIEVAAETLEASSDQLLSQGGVTDLAIWVFRDTANGRNALALRHLTVELPPPQVDEINSLKFREQLWSCFREAPLNDTLSLYDLLSSMPNLTHLTLRGFSFLPGEDFMSSTSALGDLREEQDPTVAQLVAPHLFMLVSVLTTRSKLLAINIVTLNGHTIVRFLRRVAADQFKPEWIVPLEWLNA
ncbi:hypothetical protein JCM10908_006301 [Rhodotorula pacifica]|uniref:uncharacterized protein n=1 Tax=Rhodotorula pacifica TaxID=1495444 RepID=UPI00316CF508